MVKTGKKTERLDKFLTQAAKISRSEAKQAVRKGQVMVNDILAKKGEQKVDPKVDRIVFCGRELEYEPFRYWMLYKPAGVISATEDARSQTVLDLIKEEKKGIFPVGRLDKDTEGLLLLTNDGALAHRLLSPRKHVEKKYFAILDGEIGEKEKQLFAQGIDIGDEKKTLPAILEDAGEKGQVWITLQEGGFHQIKRMAQAVGRKVVYLKRVSMGPLVLDEKLKPGEYRPLTKEEREQLL